MRSHKGTVSVWIRSIGLLGLLFFVESIYSASVLKDDAELSGVTVQSVAWSPNGTQIAVGKGHGICGEAFGDERFDIQILDATTGQEMNRLVQPRCTQTALAWSSDGTMLASADNSASNWLWDVELGAVIDQFSVGFQGSPALFWTPDNGQICGIADDSIYVYDLASQTKSWDFPDYRTTHVTAISLNPDGNQLASGDDSGTLRILQLQTRGLVTTFAAQTSAVRALDWHPDGSQILGGFEDGTLKVWDVTSGDVILELVAHTDVVAVVAWSPEGDRFVTASHDGMIRFWDAATGNEIGKREFAGKVLTLDWSPDGKQVVYGGVRNDYQDTNAEIMDAPTS